MWKHRQLNEIIQDMKERFNKEIESPRKTHTGIKPGMKNLGTRIKTSPTDYKTQMSES